VACFLAILLEFKEVHTLFNWILRLLVRHIYLSVLLLLNVYFRYPNFSLELSSRSRPAMDASIERLAEMGSLPGRI